MAALTDRVAMAYNRGCGVTLHFGWRRMRRFAREKDQQKQAAANHLLAARAVGAYFLGSPAPPSTPTLESLRSLEYKSKVFDVGEHG
ncbi:hypothetical protein E3D03_000130 [Paracoccus sp. DMF]|nr:hypothetical protein [Paracoccus sp. DMF]